MSFLLISVLLPSGADLDSLPMILPALPRLFNNVSQTNSLPSISVSLFLLSIALVLTASSVLLTSFTLTPYSFIHCLMVTLKPKSMIASTVFPSITLIVLHWYVYMQIPLFVYTIYRNLPWIVADLQANPLLYDY